MLLFISLASLPSSIVPLVDTAVFSSRFKISFINCTNSPLLSLADCTNAVLLSLIVCIPFYFVRIRLIFNGRCRISMKSDANPTETCQIYQSDWITWVCHFLCWFLLLPLSVHDIGIESLDLKKNVYTSVFTLTYIPLKLKKQSTLP